MGTGQKVNCIELWRCVVENECLWYWKGTSWSDRVDVDHKNNHYRFLVHPPFEKILFSDGGSNNNGDQ